jgi:hypothetical protein
LLEALMLNVRVRLAAVACSLAACSAAVDASPDHPCSIAVAGFYEQTSACDVVATVTYYPASGQSVFSFGYGNDIYDGVSVAVRFEGAPALATYSEHSAGFQGGVTAAHHSGDMNVLWRALAGGGQAAGAFGFGFTQLTLAMRWPDSVRYIVHGNLSGSLQPYTQTYPVETVSATF